MNALKNSKVSVDVLRCYMTLIAFTFTFGPYVVEKLNNNQSKVNSMFSLPLNQRTDTVELKFPITLANVSLMHIQIQT